MQEIIIAQQMKDIQWKSFKNLKSLLKTKNAIIWLVYHQGKIFQKVKDKERFLSMVLRFGVSKSTIVFKIALSKLIDNFPKIKITSQSHHYFKTHLKTIRQICKENAREFKWITKICLNAAAFL